MKAPLLLLAGLVMAGCAKFPGSGTAGGNTQVKFSMTVAGHIKPNYIYVVAIRWAKANPPFDQERGPVPVIASPWGNGMVAGRCNVYVKWDAFQSPEFQVFKFTNPIPDDQFPQDGVAYSTNSTQTGFPLNPTEVGENTHTIEFTLDLSQIAESSGDIPLLRNLQVNFLTMDRVPQDPSGGSKVWDGLGDNGTIFGVDNFIRVSLDQNNIYSNSTTPYIDLETEGDTPDPDLDIIDWSVQVTRP